MALTLLMIAIGLIVFLGLPVLGGAGLLLGVFSGFKAIPSFVWIGLIILIVFLLFRRIK